MCMCCLLFGVFLSGDTFIRRVPGIVSCVLCGMGANVFVVPWNEVTNFEKLFRLNLKQREKSVLGIAYTLWSIRTENGMRSMSAAIYSQNKPRSFDFHIYSIFFKIIHKYMTTNNEMLIFMLFFSLFFFLLFVLFIIYWYQITCGTVARVH